MLHSVSASDSNLNPRNTQCVPVVKIFAFPHSKSEISDLSLNKIEHFSKVSNPRVRTLLMFSLFFVGLFFVASNCHSAKPIARISGFEGEVIVLSDTRIIKVTQSGVPLNKGDRIQTKQGKAEIIFDDGAVMKLNSFTNAMIQERKEKEGWFVFGTKKAARRITCFVGKLWFKSGSSKTKTYLQTPSAVCGLRGSDADIGFDNVNTYLNMYTGQAKVVGNVLKGFFGNPGSSAAQKSRAYRSLAKAHKAAVQAEAKGGAVDLAKAKVEANKAVKEAATILAQNNPDKTVAGEAKVAANVAIANIAAGEAEVAVSQLKEAGADQAQIETARTAADKAQANANLAEQAADKIYEDGALNTDKLDEAVTATAAAAADAQNAAQEAIGISEEVVSTTTTTETDETTTTTTTEEMPTSTEETTSTTTTTTTEPTTTTFLTTTTTTTTFPTTTTTTEVSPSQ